MQPTFFETPADYRRWLQEHHLTASELLVGFHKVGSGKGSISWKQSVDEALCFGWIDGVRRRIDATSYCIRFTPRKQGSVWSAVNIKRVSELMAEKRVRPAGRKAFAARREQRSGVYSYEKRPTDLSQPYAGMLAQAPRAQKFFAAQPASYRRAAIWWVLSAKQADTRERRTRELIKTCQQGARLPQFTRRPSS